MSDVVVLLRSRPFFGAQLVMLPALYQLKQWLPDHHLRVVARDPLGSLFGALPWVDEFTQAPSWRDEWRAIGSQCRVLVGLHPSSERHGLLAGLRRPPVRIGYRNQRLTDRVWNVSIAADSRTYRALHCLDLLAAWRPLQPLAVAAAATQRLARSLPAARWPEPGGIVLMPGGGAGDFKKWGIQRFVELLDALDQQYRWSIPQHVILGPAEMAEAEYLKGLQRPRMRVWYQPSLPALAALTYGARLIVANDCGPSHLAQCSARPLVSLFDEIKPEWFWSRSNATCLTPLRGATLQQLPVAQVLAACAAVLAAAE